MSAADREQAIHLLGAVYEHMKKGEEGSAEVLLLKCLQVDPYSAACHQGLGIVKARRFDNAGAIQHYEKFLELAPKDKDAPDARAAIEVIKARGKE